MTDDWEDWEAEDFALPVLNVHNEEQLKRLEERKLVEESDNKLTNELFSNKAESLIHEHEEVSNKNISKPLPSAEKKAPNKNFASKKLENEKKQKEISRKNKEDKKRKEKAAELYGEAEEDDEYTKYEDMFY